MPDKTLTCRDCGENFVFTAGEQEFYATKGYTNEPGRCPSCRATRKETRSGDRGGSYRPGNGSMGRNRQMYPAVCGQCGKETQVPFQPRGDRPVYCSTCFEAQRGSSGTSRRGGRF
jgi:CxxC-x17-CxxC domain-containing protein